MSLMLDRTDPISFDCRTANLANYLPMIPSGRGAQRDASAGRGNGRARGDGDRGDGAGVGVDNATLWLQRLRLRRTVANPIWKT